MDEISNRLDVFQSDKIYNGLIDQIERRRSIRKSKIIYNYARLLDDNDFSYGMNDTCEFNSSTFQESEPLIEENRTKKRKQIPKDCCLPAKIAKTEKIKEEINFPIKLNLSSNKKKPNNKLINKIIKPSHVNLIDLTKIINIDKRNAKTQLLNQASLIKIKEAERNIRYDIDNKIQNQEITKNFLKHYSKIL